MNTLDEPVILAPQTPRWHLPRMQEAGLLAVVLVMGAGLSIYGFHDARPGRPNTFLNFNHITDQIATPMSYFAIMAVGMTFVILTGGIDISVGSTMALAGLGTASVLQRLAIDAPAVKVLPVALAVPLGIGLVCGLCNGLLVIWLKVHPFILTLGTLSIYRCIAIVFPPVQTLPEAGKYLPEAFSAHFLRLKVHGLEPMPLLIMLACVLAGWVYLSRTVGGREIYAVGGNEEAARFSGISVNWVKLRVYILSGVSAGIAGMVSLGRFGTASTTTGMGYELTVVAAAVVGGASLNGGRGSAIGAMLGALIIAMIEDGIITLHLKQEYRLGIIGIAIIAAVSLDRFSEHLRARRLVAGN